ncbi:hypothetical protein, partial [Pseudomonas sp. NPDC087614]|uniref:hypothetical protein n=1 Tax=Pseudomonas sp. NPDC087614 TaxID=3364442 RepID=UPI00382B0DA8
RDVPLRAQPFSKCLVDEKRPAPAFLSGRGFFAHTVFGAGRKRRSVMAILEIQNERIYSEC